MSDFNAAFQYVLVNEGGFSDDDEDSGGATNFGITHDDFAKFLGHAVSTEDVKNMTQDQAQAAYLEFYWTPLRLEAIVNDGVATCIFDTGVNRGISVGSKYAQRVCNILGSELSIDGQIGPLTIAEVNKYDQSKFINVYFNLVKAGYDSIVANHPSQNVFYRGWMNRANRLLTLIS